MGTLINVAAIIVATFLGIIFKKGLSEKIQKAIMFTLGLGLTCLALGWFIKDFIVIENGVLSTQNDLLIIISLVIGVIIGESIDIDKRLNDFVYKIEKKYKLPPLAKGFIAATLIFCVGAMAITGAIQDGLGLGMTTLIIKSVLDFITAMVLASFLGIGVIFSAFSVLIYQGSITLLARYLSDYATPELIGSISMIGSILLVAIGINFMEIKKIKVANLLPALLIPIIYYLILMIF
ncbi:MAG: DUF554 domain-containing protein [Acholeplasmataceae bacterium]|nr:DUF554 domain-containing protein [Acholeplasmataceae bacterium]